MSLRKRIALASLLTLSGLAVTAAQQQPSTEPAGQEDRFRFRSRVELVNVTATVTDLNGRFVPGLQKEDFRVYEDERLQNVTNFTSERVPVSLGIVLDMSTSMEGDKIKAARAAIDSFLNELTDPQDEFFLYRFSDTPVLLQDWTRDRNAITRALARSNPKGGTAIYDAVSAALPRLGRGKNQKKALVVISDGNDTSSVTSVRELRQQIRESEALVYAIGIDRRPGADFFPDRYVPRTGVPGGTPPAKAPIPLPEPFGQPPRPGLPGQQPTTPTPGLQQQGTWQWPGPRLPQPPRPQPQPPGRFPSPSPPPPTNSSSGVDDPVNSVVLRDITDDSGGRTAVVRSGGDLQAATSSIAAELSQQYLLGYPGSDQKDGRWHAIRVEVENPSYRVRHRRGYIAS
jgi:Mg-chelatase subunit ChlD